MEEETQKGMTTNNETFWKNIKFILIFLLSTSVLFIILTKGIFNVPLIESSSILNNINNSEEILKTEQEYVKKVIEIGNQIDSLAFDIHQVQRSNEIKKRIFVLQDIYLQNNRNGKYSFSLQATKILQLHFEAKEELGSVSRSNEDIKKKLNECKANI